MHFKGLATSAVYRSSALPSGSQIYQSSVLQITLAPELERYAKRNISNENVLIMFL
jgi:hypothetical protein